MPEIIYGDPSNTPASYTRFVLPFAYSLSKISDKEKTAPRYEFVEVDDLEWRKSYLTHETADVLFRRAKWAKLKGEVIKEDEMFFRDGNRLKVVISSPDLILFEWPAPDDKKRDDDIAKEKEILHTGFLVVEAHFPLSNTCPPTLDNLLELNELFRYWQQPYEGHEEKYAKLFDGCVSSKSARNIYFEKWAQLLEHPIYYENEEWRLMPDKWMASARRKVDNCRNDLVDDSPPDWMVYADNRAFVWTCAIMKDGANKLCKSYCRPNAPSSDFAEWRALLNVDFPSGVINTEFEREWTKERTYKRWRHFGTLYGFSYHSGAMLGPPEDDPALWKHFGQMYLDQVILLLYLRIGLFRFSRELSRISSQVIDGKKDDKKWLDGFTKLRRNFTLFTNLYQFPLISNQQQGLEMYSLARKSLDVDDLFKEVQNEINGCHEYLNDVEMEKLTSSTTRLSVVATIGLIFALTFGFWSMNAAIIGKFLDFFANKEIPKEVTCEVTYSWSVLSAPVITWLMFIGLFIIVVKFSDSLTKSFGWLAKTKVYDRLTKWVITKLNKRGRR